MAKKSRCVGIRVYIAARLFTIDLIQTKGGRVVIIEVVDACPVVSRRDNEITTTEDPESLRRKKEEDNHEDVVKE